jgi:hypothetical protein
MLTRIPETPLSRAALGIFRDRHQQEAHAGKATDIPVYDSDGATVIGQFVVEGGSTTLDSLVSIGADVNDRLASLVVDRYGVELIGIQKHQPDAG